MQCRSCEQCFTNGCSRPQWQEIRFTQWMDEAAIREFESQHDLDSPKADLTKVSPTRQHVLRLNELTR